MTFNINSDVGVKYSRGKDLFRNLNNNNIKNLSLINKWLSGVFMTNSSYATVYVYAQLYGMLQSRK